VGVGAERWACVMHVSCAVSPYVDCGGCTVVQLCRLSVCCVACEFTPFSGVYNFNIYIYCGSFSR
jgi:hypothetical protein